jgi:hypothetical protein
MRPQVAVRVSGSDVDSLFREIDGSQGQSHTEQVDDCRVDNGSMERLRFFPYPLDLFEGILYHCCKSRKKFLKIRVVVSYFANSLG